MANRRRDKDVMKLMVSQYKVDLPDESKMNELIVDFPGPQDSPYSEVSHIPHYHKGLKVTKRWPICILFTPIRLETNQFLILRKTVGSLEGASPVARSVSDQVTLNRIP